MGGNQLVRGEENMVWVTVSSNLFPDLKKHLCGQRFLIDDELKYARVA